jgi:hypothetical protein
MRVLGPQCQAVELKENGKQLIYLLAISFYDLRTIPYISLFSASSFPDSVPFSTSHRCVQATKLQLRGESTWQRLPISSEFTATISIAYENSGNLEGGDVRCRA